MADEPKLGEVKPVSDRELEIAFSGLAAASNRFFISLRPGGVRIAFTEQRGPDREPVFRSAVMLSMQDGIALYRMLSEMLKDVEATIEKAEPALTESAHKAP